MYISRCDNQNGLGQWISTQSLNYTNGELNEDRCAKFDTTFLKIILKWICICSLTV